MATAKASSGVVEAGRRAGCRCFISRNARGEYLFLAEFQSQDTAVVKDQTGPNYPGA